MFLVLKSIAASGNKISYLQQYQNISGNPVDFGETFVDFQISELIPNKKLVWLVTDCNLHWINNKKEWNGTEVVFEISSARDKTKIDFTHIGLVRGAECYEDCEVGWTEHITDSLVKFINEGKGKPQ